jgi:hypothetical protein
MTHNSTCVQTFKVAGLDLGLSVVMVNTKGGKRCTAILLRAQLEALKAWFELGTKTQWRCKNSLACEMKQIDLELQQGKLRQRNPPLTICR